MSSLLLYSSLHKVIVQYCSSVWCQHGDYACGVFRGNAHEWSWIAQAATVCTSNQTSWLYISYLNLRIPASHWTNVWFAPYIPCSFRKILWATRSGHMPWLSHDFQTWIYTPKKMLVVILHLGQNRHSNLFDPTKMRQWGSTYCHRIIRHHRRKYKNHRVFRQPNNPTTPFCQAAAKFTAGLTM